MTDKQCVITVLGLEASPKAIDSLDPSWSHSGGITNCVPGFVVVVNQSVSDVHNSLVVAGASGASFENIYNVFNIIVDGAADTGS